MEGDLFMIKTTGVVSPWPEYSFLIFNGSAIPDFDHRDRDWKYLSLNNETETETEKVWV